MQAGDDGEDDEPEPEEDVDLLVDDVHAQHAEGVETLDRTGASVLVEDALCHLDFSKGILFYDRCFYVLVTSHKRKKN